MGRLEEQMIMSRYAEPLALSVFSYPWPKLSLSAVSGRCFVYPVESAVIKFVLQLAQKPSHGPKIMSWSDGTFFLRYIKIK
jgi:hypothetical protein